MKKLSQLKIGESGVIQTFSDEDIYIKLMEMGCVPGEMVTVINKAPMGDPICISVVGYVLSLRLDEASEICVDSISLPSESKK